MGYMERSRPVIPLPDMDIPAAKTTVDFSDSITNVRITPMTTTVKVAGTSGANESSVVFTMKVNGDTQGGDGKLTLNAAASPTTEWTYEGTILSLSFSARQTAFRFTGAVSTDIILPTALRLSVDLLGLTTIFVAADPTNIIVDSP